MLSAVGNVVNKVQEAVTDVTGLGKEHDTKADDRDTQQAPDQAPAGAGDEQEPSSPDDPSPEFTTTSKETTPSGKDVVVTTHDDVPVPEDDTQAAAAPEEDPEAAPSAKATPPPEAAAPSTTPEIPATEQAAPASSTTPESAPMNALRNMGGGSVAHPKTSRAWKQQQDSWHPDAGGVMHPPNFFINRRRPAEWA